MKIAEDFLLAALVAVSLGTIGLSTSGWSLGSTAPETVVASAADRPESGLLSTHREDAREPRLASAEPPAMTRPNS
jgi:hypothetical protein